MVYGPAYALATSDTHEEAVRMRDRLYLHKKITQLDRQIAQMRGAMESLADFRTKIRELVEEAEAKRDALMVLSDNYEDFFTEFSTHAIQFVPVLAEEPRRPSRVNVTKVESAGMEAEAVEAEAEAEPAEAEAEPAGGPASAGDQEDSG